MTARVVVARESGDDRVTLELSEDAGRCPGCAGTCLWRRLGARRLAGLSDTRGLTPGEAVELSLPEHYLFFGALAVYGLPLAGLLTGAAAGAYLTGTDLGVVAGAVAGVVLLYLLTPRLRRRIEHETLRRIRIKRLP